MLSSDTVKLLRWFSRHDKWMTSKTIEKDCKHFSSRSFRVLVKEKYLESRLSDIDGQWAEYRISDMGKACVEGARYARTADVREWMSFGLSAAAIVISIIATIMQ